MSKGINRSFNNAFDINTVKYGKGRSSQLNKRRNECLIDRYFFYAQVSQKRYELVLQDVANDFFISVVTVVNILQKNYNALSATKKHYNGFNEYKLRAILKKKWRHLDWSYTY